MNSTRKATSRFDSYAVDDILDILPAISSPWRASLREETFKQVIVKAIKDIFYEDPHRGFEHFDDVLHPIQHLINTVIQGSLMYLRRVKARAALSALWYLRVLSRHFDSVASPWLMASANT